MDSQDKSKLWAVRDERGTFLCWSKLPPPRVNSLFLIDEDFAINMGDPPGKAEFPIGSVVQITALKTGEVQKAVNNTFSSMNVDCEFEYKTAIELQREAGELMNAEGTVLNAVVAEVLAMWLVEHPQERLERHPDRAWWKELIQFAEGLDK
ncbi:MAG: hypothetical protein JWM11_7143 [Planctomycetaceae bacterium]|nr:hypothetical protein [Planctomycetaceae bacterium]